MGAYCAGMNHDSSPRDVLDALQAEPNLETPASKVIRWLLGSIKMHEVRMLNTRCGVPIFCLAEHVRAHDMKASSFIESLNQFAVVEAELSG